MLLEIFTKFTIHKTTAFNVNYYYTKVTTYDVTVRIRNGGNEYRNIAYRLHT